jgi:hypothetical protein
MYMADLRGRRTRPTTYLYCNGKNPKLIPKKSLLFVIVNVGLQAKALESDLQTKLNFTGRSEREHAGPHADAIRIVCRRIRAINGTGGAGKEAGHHARRQVEVGKVEQVVEPD